MAPGRPLTWRAHVRITRMEPISTAVGSSFLLLFPGVFTLPHVFGLLDVLGIKKSVHQFYDPSQSANKNCEVPGCFLWGAHSSFCCIQFPEEHSPICWSPVLHNYQTGFPFDTVLAGMNFERFLTLLAFDATKNSIFPSPHSTSVAKHLSVNPQVFVVRQLGERCIRDATDTHPRTPRTNGFNSHQAFKRMIRLKPTACRWLQKLLLQSITIYYIEI